MMKGKQLRLVPVAIAALTVVLAPRVFAQAGMGQNMRMPRYDTSTTVTIHGTIQEVREGMMQRGSMGMMGTGRMGSMGGLHLVVKTKKETVTVLAGPASYAKDKGFTFAKGDKVEISGSRVTYNDAEAIIAREIKKGGKTLVLRNANGVPEWSRGRRQ